MLEWVDHVEAAFLNSCVPLEGPKDSLVRGVPILKNERTLYWLFSVARGCVG